jgi:regulator of protease activity HflC (stomatin/prohibitin superfamily)
MSFALLVAVVFAFAAVRIGRVTGEEVGILLNRINGSMTVIEQSGVRIYNGLISDFFVLDKTLQTLTMSGGRTGDSLKVKTVDGSDVYVDLKVQYRIEPGSAKTIVTTSGPGDAFKEKWARDYCRSVCRNYLGGLTTEQFYDAAARETKLVAARSELGELMAPFGIVIDSIVIPQRPQFYAEYEEMIKKKKLADQEVLEEQSKALAAEQKQKTLIVSATNEKNVAVERFKGDMEKLIIQAKAEAEKIGKAADAYYARVTIGAEATLYRSEKEAGGVLARKKSEAEGIEALKKALQGVGGRNMVKLEYAKKLKGVTISGQPFTIEGRTERFQHTSAGAASVGRQSD